MLVLSGLAVGIGWLTFPADRALTPDQARARREAFDRVEALTLPPVPRQNRAAALEATKLPASERAALQQQLEQKRGELVWLTLWDDFDQDGDTVDVESDGFRQTVALTNAPIKLAVPRPASGVVNVYGIYDGGGGITVAVGTQLGKVALPVMVEGQVIGIPVR